MADVFPYLVALPLLALAVWQALALRALRRGQQDLASREMPAPPAPDLAPIERALRDEARWSREEQDRREAAGREERQRQAEAAARGLAQFGGALDQRMEAVRGVLDQNLRSLAEGQDRRLDDLRRGVEERMGQLAQDTRARLGEMRQVVDKELRESVERRFDESFRTIGQRLDLVHQGLGEMQQLAAGVGDLKRTLSGSKTRGILGEMQLAALLELVLAPGQYEADYRPAANSQEKVEFAVRYPGAGDDGPVYLPIDSKCPLDDYQRLLDAYDAGEGPEEVARWRNALAAAVRRAAKDIRDKYVKPPATTDFAVLFVPFEGLYAEILRLPGVFEDLHQQCKVTVAGPATLAALLNSLLMGFRTLAIQKKSGEVWRVLGAVKAEFGRYGKWVDGMQAKMASLLAEIENARTRTRMVQSKLKTVEELPAAEAAALLDMPAGVSPEAEEEGA